MFKSPSFQKEELEQERPIVIQGRGHSGTRVLSWACTHLGINLGTREDLATGDVSDLKFSKSIKEIAIRNVGITQDEEVKSSDLARFQKAVFKYYSQLGKPECWGWKFPETYFITPYIARIFPKAQYIHLVRDGRDVAFKTHATDQTKHRIGKKVLSQCNALKQPHHLQAALSWAFQVDAFDQYRPSIPSERIFDMTFEDLCTHPHEVMKKLCDFLQMDYTLECQNYLDQNLNSKKVSEFQNKDSQLVRKIEERIGETLKRYNYL